MYERRLIIKKGDQTHKEAGVASDGQFWISKTLATLARLDKDSKHVSPPVSLDEETQTSLGKAQKQLENLASVSLIIMHVWGLPNLRKKGVHRTKRDCEGLRTRTIIPGSAVSMWRGRQRREPRGTAVGYSICVPLPSMADISPKACLAATSRMFTNQKSSKKHKNKQTALPPADDEAIPIDIFVDLLIGYLESASAYTRSVANEAFSRVTGVVQESTMNLILTVCDTCQMGGTVLQV